MSLLIYAGSMQYVAVGLLTGGASLLTAGVTALMVNARHLFYGISMLEKYRKLGFRKPYLIFTLTDETYSLVCSDHPEIPEDSLPDYYFLVSLFDHMYWVAGSVLGALVGSVITFNTEGIDFALTALFLTVFTEQWLSTREHVPALVGVGASVLCLILFGPDNFLIPTMAVIGITLCLRREEVRHA
jgi:4-azaleucine resistance transporter AzlC